MAQISVETKEIDAFVKQFKSQKYMRETKIIRAVEMCMWAIYGTAVEKHLTGGNPIHRRTGTNIIAKLKVKKTTKSGTRYTGQLGTVGTAGKISVGRVMEYGAQTPGHIVKPKNVNPATGKKFKFLRFRAGTMGSHGQATGNFIFAKQVKMLPKQWMRPSINETKPKIYQILEKAGLELL